MSQHHLLCPQLMPMLAVSQRQTKLASPPQSRPPYICVDFFSKGFDHNCPRQGSQQKSWDWVHYESFHMKGHVSWDGLHTHCSNDQFALLQLALNALMSYYILWSVLERCYYLLRLVLYGHSNMYYGRWQTCDMCQNQTKLHCYMANLWYVSEPNQTALLYRVAYHMMTTGCEQL